MCMEQGARSLFRHTIYQYSVLCTPVDPWVTTGQSHYSRRTRVHLHYLCIKYAPQASTVTHVIAQRGSDRPISGSPGRKNQKKKHKIMPPYVFLPRIQPRDLLHFAFSLSFRSFILTSSLSLSLYYYPLLPYLYFNFLLSTCSTLSFLFVILRRP